jgi:hypothetical protein
LVAVRVAGGMSTNTPVSARDPQCPLGPQAGNELPLQRAPALDVEGLVDGLVGDPHGFIIGEIDAELVGKSAPGSNTCPTGDRPDDHDVGR